MEISVRSGTDRLTMPSMQRRKSSRTRMLAGYLISKLGERPVTVRLSETKWPLFDDAFLDKRNAAVRTGDYSDPLFDAAKQFALADTVVIAAPYWDLSFPASLKQYFEQITVSGLTFRYSEEGIPQPLCRAKTLWYVTTAGGRIYSYEYGYGYVRALTGALFGIRDARLIAAEELDAWGADVGAILEKARKRIDVMVLDA